MRINALHRATAVVAISALVALTAHPQVSLAYSYGMGTTWCGLGCRFNGGSSASTPYFHGWKIGYVELRTPERDVSVRMGRHYLLMEGSDPGIAPTFQYYTVILGTDQRVYEPDLSDVADLLSIEKIKQPVFIRPGMKLRWSQYNHRKRTMSVNILFTDYTSLQYYNLHDQNGVPIHPASRIVYPEGVWRDFVVDLAPVVGKQIQAVKVGYDTGDMTQSGEFRAYFDNLQLTTP